MMPISTLHFETHEAYIAWLKKTSEARKAKEIADHERAHVEMARSLGYDAVYATQVFSSDPLVPFAFYTDFRGTEPTDEHLITICLAPDKPSLGDQTLVERLRRKQKIK